MGRSLDKEALSDQHKRTGRCRGDPRQGPGRTRLSLPQPEAKELWISPAAGSEILNFSLPPAQNSLPFCRASTLPSSQPWYTEHPNTWQAQALRPSPFWAVSPCLCQQGSQTQLKKSFQLVLGQPISQLQSRKLCSSLTQAAASPK